MRWEEEEEVRRYEEESVKEMEGKGSRGDGRRTRSENMRRRVFRRRWRG